MEELCLSTHLSSSMEELSLSLLFNEDDAHNPIPDSMYADELQLQEAIVLSLTNLTEAETQNQTTSDSSSVQPASSSTESGKSSRFLSEICAEHKGNDQMFAIRNCTQNLLFNEDDADNLIPNSMDADELQLQEAIILSLTNLTDAETQNQTTSDSSSVQPASSSRESGKSSRFLCEICAEDKGNDQMFAIRNCTHKFCTDCISKHISIIIQDRKGVSLLNPEKAPVLACPGPDCDGVLEMDICRQVVSKKCVAMWDDALCEATIEPSKRFYCPYKDCSGLLENDSEAPITEAECPSCRRLMCVRCSVPWHAGIGCEEFSKLGKDERERDDVMVHEMAKQNKWQRCPKCKFYVEKSRGCTHMSCRCGFEFCYECAKPWKQIHECNPRI